MAVNQSQLTTKRKAHFIILAAFVLGIVVGASGQYLLLHRSLNNQAVVPVKTIDELTQRLNLTPDQRNRIDQLLSDSRRQFLALDEEVRPQYKSIRLENRKRISAVLTSDQQPLFEQYTRELDAKREAKEREAREKALATPTPCIGQVINHNSTRNRNMENSGNRFPAPRLIFTLFVFALILSASCSRSGSGNELVMMLEKRVSTFDPRVSSDSADERMRQLIFNGLTRKNEKFDPVPDLAESFESSPDFKTFTFRLRQGVKFHNDQKLSALDVKYTFDTMLATGFTSAKKVEFTRLVAPDKPLLAGVEVSDPLTVIFHCNEPCPGLANQIVPVGIIPEGTTDQQAKKPVGTGPFKFESFTEDQEVVLAANPQYYNGPPSIERLRVKIIPDNSTRESELRKGSVDLAINADFDPVTVEGLQKAAPTIGLKVETIDGTNITHLGVNLLDPILKDQRIRQALAFAIDRESIIRDVLRSQAKIAHSILPMAQWAYEPGVAAYAYDAERAKKLLDEAGRTEKDGQRLKLTLKTSTVSIAKKTAEAIQAQLARVGVKLEIQTLERQKLTQDMTDGNFQLYLNTSVGGNQSTDIFAFMYGAKSIPPNGQNRMRYNNPAVDKLLSEAMLASPDRRKQIFSEVQKTLSNDLPQIYLWYPATIVVYRNRVGNLKIEPSGDWQVVRNVKLN